MLQRFINFIYRYPKARLQNYNRFGGYFNYRSMMYSMRLMKKASLTLAPVTSYPDGLPVYFLTGEKFLYQTLFCIQSLKKVSRAKFNYILIDDGSFGDSLIKQVERQLPGAQIILQAELEQNIEKYLPESLYPALYNKRKVYPHLKKLTDVHTLPGKHWKLVLDSDMLFWAEPTKLISWLNNPVSPLHMVDCEPSYGYTGPLMEQLAGSAIRPLINVGAIGLKSDTINWAKVNHWIKVLEEKEGGSYYLEQALTAMLIGDAVTTTLPADTYIVNPAASDVVEKNGTLHHYVDLSKAPYFKLAWRQLVD